MTRFMHAGVAAAAIAVCSAQPFSSAQSIAAGPTEILWDRYGVPHIYAADRESMFYAHGWAQMRNHADLLLRLYGESRGRAAEYWGGDANLELDRWVQLNGVPERARRWYDAQDPRFRKYLDEFARGINEFAAKNPSAIDPEFRVVLPVSGVDVVQHPLRAVHYGYMGSRARMNTEVNALLRDEGRERAAGAGRGAPATDNDEWPRVPTPGPSVLPNRRAATRCSSSTRICPGATRSTATCRCTWSALITIRWARRKSGFRWRWSASTGTPAGDAP